MTTSHLLSSFLPYLGVFLVSLGISLALTPLVRGMNRRLGMVDKPGGRRINKTPVPRGGGVAVIVSFIATTLGFMAFCQKPVSPGAGDAAVLKFLALSAALGAVGFWDDKFGMKPSVKLLAQLAIAGAVYFWCGIGFHRLFPSIPACIDMPLTMFWIAGAINAFNLIDGLDGLASGLAVIAAAGMAGALVFLSTPGQIFLHVIFIGAVLGFLRYNFNPASVFLGDTGAMFLGFFLSVIALATRTGDSLVVSVAVPLLAMGVPIFDTALAIVRRTIRALLGKVQGGGDASKIMQPDSDHSHHRLLRRFVSQRKVATIMYFSALALVLAGIGGIALRDRGAGLFVVAFVIAVTLAVKDMARIELMDAGRLADAVVHGRDLSFSRRLAFMTPILLVADVIAIAAGWFIAMWLLDVKFTPPHLRVYLPLRVIAIFLALVFARTYGVLWSRAMLSNYARLAAAVILGVAFSSSAIVLLGYKTPRPVAFPAVYACLVVAGTVGVRILRPLLRDYYYFLSSNLSSGRKGVSRVLVYGAGLRYRAFRRELVRRSSAMDRVIVGILDDNILLKGKRIGGVRIDGPHMDVKRIIEETRADSVVIACELPEARRKVAIEAIKSCGVKVTCFDFSETEI